MTVSLHGHDNNNYR